MKKALLLTLLGVSVHTQAEAIFSRPVEFEFEINTVCQKDCSAESEIPIFKEIYKGSSRNKLVNFIDPHARKVLFSVPIEEIYTATEGPKSIETSETEPLVGLMDGGLDCFPNNREPWCQDGWNQSPEWENYMIALQEHLFNSRTELLITQDWIDSQQGTFVQWVWAVAVAVPSARITSNIIKMIEKFGPVFVNSKAVESLVGGTVGTAFSTLSRYPLKVGDKIVIANGKWQVIRNGVVIEEQDLIPPASTYTAPVFGSGGGEGDFWPFPRNPGGGSFCMMRTFGTVTTGGGVTFWVDYTPCATGIYEP